MKRMNKPFYILGIAVSMLALNGCKTNNMMHCPDLASTKKAHTSLFAFNRPVPKAKPTKPVGQPAGTLLVDSTVPETLAAATGQDMHFKMKMPAVIEKQMQDDKDMDDMNKLLANYSDNKIALQRNDKAKLYLQAHSVKDVLALVKNASHPRGYYERRYGSGSDPDGSAIASGVMGPISFLFAFIPFLSFLAIPLSIAAIVTGAVGLRSHRHRLASMGLTFGILGLIFSVLMSFFYLHLFFAFWV